MQQQQRSRSVPPAARGAEGDPAGHSRLGGDDPDERGASGGGVRPAAASVYLSAGGRGPASAAASHAQTAAVTARLTPAAGATTGRPRPRPRRGLGAPFSTSVRWLESAGDAGGEGGGNGGEDSAWVTSAAGRPERRRHRQSPPPPLPPPPPPPRRSRRVGDRVEQVTRISLGKKQPALRHPQSHQVDTAGYDQVPHDR